MKVRAILTFDIEFWYSDIIENDSLSNEEKRQLKNFFPESVDKILNLLKKHNTEATFFILGQVAEEYPGLVKKIIGLGHEIGSHSYTHRKINEIGKKEFGKEIKSSAKILKKITNKNPSAFRAPDFSLDNKNKWAFKILEKQRFKCDSSIFPIKTPFFGTSDSPLKIHRISNLLELPVAVYKFGKIKIPIGGGLFFRFPPLFIYIKLLKLIAKKRIPILYFHPYDLYGQVPKNCQLSWFRKTLRFWGVKKAWKKFEKLFEHFDFISINNYLKFHK